MKNHTFIRKTLVLQMLAALPIITSAAPYQQGGSATATVDAGERVEKVDTVTATIKKDGKPDRKAAVGTSEKDFNRSGNPVRIIWYGNPKDADSKIAQTGALNNGHIHGKVVATGTLTTKKTEKGATVELNGQANAIDALGWTPASNPNDIDINLATIDNRRSAVGEAVLQGGLAGVHGNVSSFGSANGISVVALADFGKAGVGGVDGSSGATGKSSSGGSGSINNDEDEIEDDDLLGLLEGNEDPERSPKNTDKSDMYGKNLKTAVARVHNSGSVSGNITARAQQLKRPLNKNSYTPQFYDVSLITSGNGVSMANYIETPDKYTYSQEKQNHVHLGTLDNSGSLRGQATLEGGTRTTHTYTASKGSGNGVSLFASTGRFAKNATRVALDNVNNSGDISGSVRQTAGNNSGYNSPHMMSGSEAHGSGNGISLYSDTFNAQIPRVETRLGKINNHGSIRGDAYLKAGDGSGDLSIEARASGNGISVYQATGNASLTALESVNNEGIIQGHIETRAGTVYSSAQRGQTIPEERARLVVSDGKTIADYYKPNPTPEKPASAGDDNYGTFANFHADSDVRASGNGISVQYASGVGADVNSGASLGDITNGGVISGYAENYHGYARGYGRVSTLNSGAGIATDRKITSNITNRGIISGNHAAILAKGRVDDSQSIREPNLEPGYEPGKIQNYGLMAGSMIAGSYRAGVGSLLSREQNFDHFDSSAAANDPLENYGSKIYLKTGIRRVAEYNTPTERSDDYEHIDRIENGAGGTHRINGQTYTITNGTIDASGTDSEHHASGTLRNHIVNGAGVACGALVADGKLNLSGSTVNGYANALYLGANSDVTLNNSTLNANGHKVNRSIDPLAVRGDDGANRLTLSNRSTVNGNLDLGAGDDTLTIADNSVRINGQRLNLGAGNDTVNLGQPGRRARGDNPITVHYTLEGAENLSVNQASRFTAGAKVRTNTITLNQADLTYQIDNNDQHALYDAARTSDVTLRGNGKLLIDTYKDDKAEREITLGGSGKLLNEGSVQTASTNQMQTATLADGKIKIAPRVAVQPGQSVNAQPNSAATTNTAANHTTATSTVGSLVRLNRDNDAASATFETSYADAYNSYTSAWRNTGNNPLKNSSYLPETAQAEKAVNQYLADTVAHNPYGAVPAATLAAHQDTRRALLDNHARPLRQGETYAAISGSLARNDALKTSDSKTHDNQLGIGISHGITNDLTLGITASVGREKIDSSHDSRLKGNSHYISAHAVKTLGDLSLTGGLAYSQASLKGTRHITNGYDSQSHAARNKPSVISAYAESKYTLHVNDRLAWEPKAILAYNHLKSGSVNENGNGALNIASHGMNTVDIGIGQDLTYTAKAGSGEIRGKLSLDYIHTSGEKDLQARFNGSDSTFTLRTDKNPNTVRAGLSGEYQTASGVIIRAGVSDNLRKGKNDLQGTLSVGVKF